MLERVSIHNFQSHKRSVVELSKGVNIFNGISDKGKTAIIRAIRFVVYNKPSGDGFRSWWGGGTEVELTFTDGNTIKRTKTNTENSYTINDGVPLKAFGQGVPDEVTKILNLEEVNIQQQMDSPFLLSDTSGEVATHFNRIAGISVIDKSISKAKSAVAKTKQSIEHREADLKEKQEQLLAYKDLDTVEKELKYLSKVEQEKKKLDVEIVALNMNVNRLKKIDARTALMNEFLQLEKPVQNLLRKNDEVFNEKMNNIRLKKLLFKVEVVDKSLRLCEQYKLIEKPVFDLLEKDKLLIENNVAVKKIRRLKCQGYGIDLLLAETEQYTKLEPSVSLLLAKVQNLTLFKGDLKALNNLVGKCTTLTNKVQETQERIAELVNSLPEVCPYCNGTGKLK